MSSDSTELTFVRCPSCRSLVPAISSRCRMCGATLEAAASGEESRRGTGRVRQRTMSSDADPEISEAVQQARSAEPAPPPPPPPPTRTAQEEQDTPEEVEDDPLSSYLEELDEEDEVAESASTAGESTNGIHEKEPALESAPTSMAVDEESDPVSEPPPPPPAPKQKVAAEAPRREASATRVPFDDEDDDVSPAPVKPVEPPRRDPTPVSRPQREAVARTETPAERPSPFSPPRLNGEQSRRQSLREEAPARHETRAEAPRRDAPRAAARSGAAKVAPAPGRLFGWLVSYSDPNGHALELREGKFFVTGKSLKESDLVIEDDSISTPHALVTVSVEQGLTVQDLMSERGVFVRRRGGQPYQKEENTTTLSHGDWLRFGDVEFLVSLIAHVGEV